MLSLGTSGAFDHVLHELLLILRSEGIPEWMVMIIKSFLTQRRTKILFPGHHGEFIQTSTEFHKALPYHKSSSSSIYQN